MSDGGAQKVLSLIEMITDTRDLVTQSIEESELLVLGPDLRHEVRVALVRELIVYHEFLKDAAVQLGEVIPFYERLEIEFPDPDDEEAWDQHVKRLRDG